MVKISKGLALVFAACLMLLFAFVAVFVHADLREEYGAAQDARDARIAGQYIVVFKDGVENVESAENELIGKVRGEKIDSYRHVMQGFSARFSEAELDSLKNDPRVAFVSEDRIVSIAENPARLERASGRRERGATPPPSEESHNSNPVQVQSQALPSGIDRIDAEGIATGAGVHVAVVDTGILLDHPDLAGNIAGGVKCIRASGGYSDQNGHGTHVAGTIAALNNNVGVVGVAPEAKLWAVRVLDRNGSGTWSSVICGLDFVTANAPANGGPIQVANLSLGGSGVSDNNCGNSNNDALHKAICRARDAGVTVVVAAGNSGSDAAQFVPAAYDDAVITVSALADSDGAPGGAGPGTSYGADDTFASFSNWGVPVDIGAPGVGIYSTWLSNGYNAISGTSMASPHVAGAAALYLAAFPSALWTEVRDALISTGEALGDGHTDPSVKHPERVLQVDNLSMLWSGSEPPPSPLPEDPPANTAPTANAGPDQSGIVGDTIQFDGSGSSDTDGTIVSYAWDFGDGATLSGVSASHAYTLAGTYTATLTVLDDGGLSASDSATILVEDAPLPPPPGGGSGFVDSFESGLGNWTQDSQNDWFVSSKRSTDGSFSIEVDGRASDASISSSAIDLGGSTSAVIEFDWFIERGLDSGEYIALDVSKDGGNSWQEMRILRGNVDAEDTWHSEVVAVTGISSLAIRFRGTMSRSSEDANIDNIRVVAQ